MAPSDLAEIDRSRASEPPSQPIAFDRLERMALRLGSSVDDPALADFDAHALVTAQRLAGEDRAQARFELLSKALAAARTRLLVLEAHLDQRYVAGNERAFRQSLRMVEAARRHFVALLAEHRHACQEGRRTPVKISVTNADAVNVMAIAAGS